MIIFVPVFANNSTVIENQNITIKTEVQESPETRELLKQLVQSQTDQDDKFNQLIEKMNINIGDICCEKQNDDTWHNGDLIIGSSTIIGFFGFSSLIIIKFQTNSRIKEKIRLLRSFFTAIGTVIVIHIMGIMSILLLSERTVTLIFYSYIFPITAIFFIGALNAIFRIAKAENDTESNISTEQNIIGMLEQTMSPHP